jgi:hypothetical protein
VQQTVEQLLAELQAREHDKSAVHLYRSRREYRSACDRSGKGGKQLERCLISTFQVAENLGFKGDFRQCEQLPRIGERELWHIAKNDTRPALLKRVMKRSKMPSPG